jgi:exodeoxyribonuclease VII small subunit
MKTSDKKVKTKIENFEQSIKRLESIVEDLELGNVPLENAIQLYEEGVEISKNCIQKLKDAELRIKRLTKNLSGEFSLSDESLQE